MSEAMDVSRFAAEMVVLSNRCIGCATQTAISCHTNESVIQMLLKYILTFYSQKNTEAFLQMGIEIRCTKSKTKADWQPSHSNAFLLLFGICNPERE
jgi:hypothetical protein